MKFTYNPRIIKHLGTELITSDEVAIAELIKNSYDAQSNNINLFFLNSIDELDQNLLESSLIPEVKQEIATASNGHKIILLEDDGEGMTFEQLKKGFFEVGSDIKHVEKMENETKDDPQVILGDKGIGRLSAQRLAPILYVETASQNEGKIFLVKITWNDFVENLDSEAPEIQFSHDSTSSYTRIWLLEDQTQSINFEKYYTEKMSRDEDLLGAPYGESYLKINLTTDLQSTLTFLYSPFSNNQSLVNLEVYKGNLLIPYSLQPDAYKLAEVEHNFALDTNKDGEYILSMNMKIKPWYLERIHNSMIGNNDLWVEYHKDAKFYQDILNKFEKRFSDSLSEEIPLNELLEAQPKKLAGCDAIKEISPLKGKVLSFKRNRKLLDIACKSAITNGYLSPDHQKNNLRIILDKFNGIKLYRNNYRIASLGNKDSDWLKLQQKRTVGQQFFRFELGNSIGHVTVNDPFQKYIRETSSREHITDTPPALALEKILDYIFNVKFYEFNRNASLITKNIFEDENLLPEVSAEKVKNEADNFKEQLDTLKSELGKVSSVFLKIKKDIDLDTPEKIQRVKGILATVETSIDKTDEHINYSSENVNSMKKTINIIESEKQRIEIEAYNNYKLMANGLITEAITHELHSVISTYDGSDCTEDFSIIKNALIDHEEFEINKQQLSPIRQRFQGMHNKILEVGNYYSFLEKTFVKKGTKDELDEVNLHEFLCGFIPQYVNRMKQVGIENITMENIDSLDIMAPKGTLVHLFYNLLNNSLYWIYERIKRGRNDSLFAQEDVDKISIVKIENQQAFLFYDTGIGVLKKYENTLFLPFISGKKNGRGMGLYIVKKMLESFDASICLLEERNKYGNRFIFKIAFDENADLDGK